MSTGQTTICNMALAHIGARTTIASLSEQSKEAQALSVWYESMLEATLRAAHWNFARKQNYLTLLQTTANVVTTVTSTQTSTTTVTTSTSNLPSNVPVPWVNEYAYPADCVQMRYLLPQFQNVPGTTPGVPTFPDYIGPPVRFLDSWDEDANGNDIKVVLTNQQQAIGVYTRLVTNEAMFDSLFVDAFAAILASRICVQLTGDKALAKQKYDIAMQLTREAQARDGNEGLTIQDSIPDWIRTRGYASDWAFPDGSYYYGGPQALSLVV